jgi:hypothetical protein
MKLSEARSLLNTTFTNAWGNTTPIIWDKTLPPTPITAFVRFSVQETTSKLESWSGDDQNWRHYGIACIQILVRAGTGTAQLDDLSDKAANILRGRRFGALNTYAAETHDDGPDGHGWEQVRVLVRFQYTKTTS